MQLVVLLLVHGVGQRQPAEQRQLHLLELVFLIMVYLALVQVAQDLQV